VSPLHYNAGEDQHSESLCKPGVSGVRIWPAECCCFARGRV